MKALTAAEMQEVDRLTTERLGIPSLQLMENAGTRAAEVCLEGFARIGKPRKVCVLCGKGNNGGDGFVIARHLEIQRIETTVLLACQPSDLTGDAAINYRVLEAARIPSVVRRRRSFKRTLYGCGASRSLPPSGAGRGISRRSIAWS
jgi:NAD(P)H-hydrate epimerase